MTPSRRGIALAAAALGIAALGVTWMAWPSQPAANGDVVVEPVAIAWASIPLFDEGDAPFAAWQCDGSGGRDEVTRVVHLDSGHGLTTARREVPWVQFELAGCLVPGSSPTGSPVERAGVRCELGPDFAVAIELRRVDRGHAVTIQRLAGANGDWRIAEPPIAIAGTWSRDRPPSFVVRREDAVLGWQVLARRDDGTLGDAGNGTFAVPATASAASLAIALFVAGGRLSLPDFALRGRP